MKRSIPAPVLLFIASAALVGCGGPSASKTASASSHPVNPDVTNVEIEFLKVGMCGLETVRPPGNVVENFPEIDCDKPHDSEVYAVEQLQGPREFPGNKEVERKSVEVCDLRFQQYVGLPWNESTLGYYYMQPTEHSWPSGDKRVVCVLQSEGQKLTGTMKGSRR